MSGWKEEEEKDEHVTIIDLQDALKEYGAT